MNSKRRADLQRKLSMGAVPRPPANLADRIKADIPKYLQVQEERDRFTWSAGSTLRVAASILLLITTAFVTLEIMQPEPQRAKSAALRRPVPAVMRGTAQQTAEAPPAATQASDEVRLDIFQDTPSAPASAPVMTQAPLMVERRREEAAANDSAAGVEGGVVGSFIEDAVQETRPLQVAEAMPAPPPPPPLAAAPAPEHAPVPPPELPVERPQSRVETITVTASAPSLVREAYAKELDLQQKTSLFGISVDPKAFDAIRTAIESGNVPLKEVNVEAVVNYFARAPLRAPQRGVGLEVEASPGPVATPGDRALLRFTIDTPRMEVGDRASVPPVAQDVRIEIDIDANAVESFRRIGGSKALTAEPTLLHNSSVTGVYELELKPRLKSSQHVATVRLRYRSIADGRERTITRVVHGHDLAKKWARSSRRHRLASLGAVFSESLKQAPPNIDVVERAEELARQNPKDERARELADTASAWSGGER